MKSQAKNPQYNLFKVPLVGLCNHEDPLFQMAEVMDWESFEETFGEFYSADMGRPAKPIRLMVALHYLKAMFGESDESVVEKWVQNPYWQYFCGETEFQHEFPIDPTSLVKWRKRISKAGLEPLLSETISCGLKTKALKRSDLKRVNVDTTVMEKAITYPTDAKLYQKMREILVDLAKADGVELRQSYDRVGQKALMKQNRYRHARQSKRANRELRKLKTYLGRVKRDIERKSEGNVISEKLQSSLSLAERLLKQERQDKNKIYSLHASEVECISKGKVHKKYEFGVKMGLVTSSKGNFILGSQALAGNPYDGHTLKKCLEQAKRLNPTKSKIEECYCDLGYRGHDYKEEDIEIQVVNFRRKRIPKTVKRWFKRRAGIEPIIGHVKNDTGRSRNHLLGQIGDEMNAILMACGYNMRKCLRTLYFWFYQIGLRIFIRRSLIKT